MLLMTTLLTLLQPENIFLDIDADSKSALFGKLGQFFGRHYGLKEAEVIESLVSRENLGSTGLGKGVAIPHGRIQGLRYPYAAFVRLKVPIDFDSPDGSSVKLLFFLLVPEQATEQHLDILSEMAQLLSDQAKRQTLQVGSVEDVMHVLRIS